MIHVVVRKGPKGDAGTTDHRLLTHLDDDQHPRLSNALSTGLIAGGFVTCTGTDNVFDLAAGTGIIVDNTTNGVNPTRTLITWEAMPGVISPYISTDDLTFIGIDINGDLVLQSTAFTTEQTCDIISIGWLDHRDRTTVATCLTEPVLAINTDVQTSAFWEALGAFNITGNDYSGTGATLALTRTAGSVFDAGVAYESAPKDPHVSHTDLNTAELIQYYHRDALGEWVNDLDQVAVIDPNTYDTGVGTDVVPAGNFTIQRIYLYAPDQWTDIMYGQVCYASMVAAEAAIQDSITTNPYLDWDLLRGLLIIKQGCVDLSDSTEAKFLVVSKFGEIRGGGTGGGTGVTDHGALTGLSDYDHPQYQATTAMSNYQAVSLMGNYLGTGYSSHTHSNYSSYSFDEGVTRSNNTVRLGGNITNNISFSLANSKLVETRNNQALFQIYDQGGSFYGAVGRSAVYNTDTDNSYQNTGEMNLYWFGPSLYASRRNLTNTIEGSNGYIGVQATQLQFVLEEYTNAASKDASAFFNTKGFHYVDDYGTRGAADLWIPNYGYFSNSLVNTTVASRVVQINGSSGTFSFNTGSSLSSSRNANSITWGLASNISTAWSGQTTANQSRVIGIAGSNASTASGNIQFANGNNVTFGLNGSTITASASYAAQTAEPRVVSINGTSGSLSFNVGSSLSSSVNGSAFTFGMASNITTALQSAGDYLTTAAVSNHSHAFSASGGSSAFQTLNFANSNGFTFSNSNGSVIGSYTVPTVPGATVFSNSNNVTFGLNGSTVTASATMAQSVQTQSRFNMTLSGNSTSAGAGYIEISSGTLTLAGGNNITLSQNGNAITISGGAAGGADGINAFVVNAGASTASTTLTLSNSNNVSFGLNAGIITASASFNQTAEPRVVSINGTSGSLSFNAASSGSISQNGSAFSFGLASNITTALQSAGAYLTTAALSQNTSNYAGISSGSQSTAGSDLVFTLNTAGLNFGVPKWLTTAQAPGAYLTTAAQSNAVVNSFNGSTGQISFVTGSGMSTTTNASTLTFGLRSDISTAWSGQTTANQSRVVQINGSSNSLSFAVGSGLSASSNASTITFGIATDYTTSLANTFMNTSERNNYQYTTNSSNNTSIYQALSATTKFAGPGFTTASTAGSDLVGTHNSAGLSLGVPKWLTVAAGGGVALAGSNTTYTSGTVVFRGTNATINTSAGGQYIDISVAAPGAAAEANWINLQGNTASNSTASGSTIMWSAGNNITLAATNGSVVRIDAAAGGGGIAAVAGAGTVTNGSLSFLNSNGFAFGIAGSNLTVSINGALLSQASGGTNTASNVFVNDYGQLGLYHKNVTNATQLTLHGVYINSNNIQLVASGESGAASVESQANIYLNSGTGLFYGPEITSYSSRASTVTAWVPHKAYVDAKIINSVTDLYYSPELGGSTHFALGQNTIRVAPMQLTNYLSASSLGVFVTYTGTLTSAVTAQFGQTLDLAIYQQNLTNSTRFDTIWSGRHTAQFWNSGTSSNSYAIQGTTSSSAASNLLVTSVMGMRIISLPVNSILSPGMYYIGLRMSTSTANYSALFRTYNPVFNASMSISKQYLGAGLAATSIGYNYGLYSVVSAAFPDSIGVSELRVSNEVIPWFRLGAI